MEIDTKKWIKISQIGYLHPKGAEEGCEDRHQKMDKKKIWGLNKSLNFLKIRQIGYLKPKNLIGTAEGCGESTPKNGRLAPKND